MMTCRELAELLHHFLDGELPDAHCCRIREHLEKCPPCVAYVETYQLTIRLTRRLEPVAPPPHLLERVRQALGRAE